MNLDLSDEQSQILDAAEALLQAEYPLSRLRSGAAEDLTRLVEFGLFGLGLAGEDGSDLLTEALLHARLGRHLLTPSTLAAAVAARLAAQAGDDALASRIADGALPVSAGVATGGDLLLCDAPGATMAVWREGDTLRWGPCDSGAAAPPAGGGLPLTRTPRPAGAATAPSAPWQLLVAAQLLGTAEAALDLSVAYARTREQFGRPIGAFQAIKHHCADMALGVAMVSAQLDFAALALEAGQEDADFQIAALARLAPRIALRNARMAIQIHGGIGFSDEADAHLILKQAHRLGQLLLPADLMALDAPLTPLNRSS
ncbi:acyl-CoA dehydrogenase family protein [Pararhodobacter aggregans]|uniref:Acyl-CoA dehydrogenase/oxidase C-terminal domain-containing protein n=1 Tax=Pararhodobacter aggregans TaxID=404875 RepID=A0A2T7UUU4_9RHOB|nr:acyl-CoA dehydrogenase family protein [Pararhodobacter aggregans]PTX04101.1 acyl-CoA dehydrogenase-like protein [Pararhodobacter aggregans]PVE48434.1 hypothetical protein DDE23_05065 [Pararhodobacter aggregans]